MLMPVYCDSSSLRVLMLKICQINGLKRGFFSILEPYFLVLYRGAHGIPIAVIKKKRVTVVYRAYTVVIFIKCRVDKPRPSWFTSHTTTSIIDQMCALVSFMPSGQAIKVVP